MAFLRALGCYLPDRVVDNTEIGSLVNAEPAWLLRVSGIEQRRFAAPEETVASIGIRAAQDCLQSGGIHPGEIGMVIAASGSGELRFPGPASAISAGLGLQGVPAIDLPMASAGSLFAIALASKLAFDYGNVLVVGSEIMSRAIRLDPSGIDTAILFGDGAGACVVSREPGLASITDSLLASEGAFAEALRLPLDGPIQMHGRTIILQAGRKIPGVILELLERNRVKPADVAVFLMHQANLNLITRVAAAVGVPEERFFHNIARYGNTSSASMLIAATEWWRQQGQQATGEIVMATFGAGLNWGAILMHA